MKYVGLTFRHALFDGIALFARRELVKVATYCLVMRSMSRKVLTVSKPTQTLFLIAIIATSGSFGPVYAQVDEPPAAPPPESVTPPPEEVAPLEDKKIDQFADAYLAIEEIHAKAAEELKSTSDPESADKVKANAEAQIIQAVERSGLRLDEFNQIAELMAVDMELRAKIASRVQERRRI